MARDKKQFWKKLAKEGARAAGERARHQAVNSQGQGGPWIGCAVLFGVFALFSTILAIIEAIERAFVALLGFLGMAVGLYLATFLLILLLGPSADWLRRRRAEWQRKRAGLASVRSSPFPRHRFLQDARYLDSIIWRMIDFHLGQETAQVRHGLGFAESKNVRIEQFRALRYLLLEDREIFETWKFDNLAAVLRNPYNEPALTGIYNMLLKRVRNEARGIEKPSELLETVGLTILRDPEPLPQLYFTRGAIRLLTWGRLCNEEPATALTVTGESNGFTQLKVQSYIANSESFRRFMERYFFEIMGELRPFEFNLPKVHQVYRRDQEKENHYALIPGTRKKLLLLPKKTETAEAEADLERHKLRAQELTRKAKEREKRIKKLRKEYLPSSRPRVIFNLFREQKTGIEEDFRELLLEQAEGDLDFVTRTLESLRINRTEFLVFWKAHEADILEAHEARVAAQAHIAADRESQLWIDRTVQQTLAEHRSAQDSMKSNGTARINLEFGYLLAAARQRVRQNLRDESPDDLENFLQRELTNLLSVDGAQSRYFSSAVRSALHECERFRQGTLSYGSQLIEMGYQPETERDSLVLAFVVHASRWRAEQQQAAAAARLEPPIPSTPEVAEVMENQEESPPRPAQKQPSVLLEKHPEAHLTTKEAAEILGSSSRTLESWRSRGGGPPYVPLSSKMVRYRLKDLLAWTEQNLRTSTSDPGTLH